VVAGSLGDPGLGVKTLDERCSRLARNFAVDVLTTEVAGAFGHEGVVTLVLKGPVLARWLYPGEVRPYVDSDLMVAPENRARAVGVLERLGFAEHDAWMPTPLSLDHARVRSRRDSLRCPRRVRWHREERSRRWPRPDRVAHTPSTSWALDWALYGSLGWHHVILPVVAGAFR
jgi:hypothetical protein